MANDQAPPPASIPASPPSDVISRLARRYNQPRDVVKRRIWKYIYSNRDYCEVELEDIYDNMMMGRADTE